jgi:hypothetical protein
MNKFAGLLGIAVLALGAPMAKATIEIEYQIDGGAIQVCASSPNDGLPGGISCSVNPGGSSGIEIDTLSATSNSNGSPTLAFAHNSNVGVINHDSTSHSLNIFLWAQNFNQPVAPPGLTFISSFAGTSTVGSNSTINLESCVDPNNSNSACAAGSFTESGGITQSLFGGIGSSGGIFGGSEIGTLGALGSPYGISEVLTISVGGGANFEFNTQSNLTPVPEPMSIGLLGGAVLLTSRLIRRKRKQSA